MCPRNNCWWRNQVRKAQGVSKIVPERRGMRERGTEGEGREGREENKNLRRDPGGFQVMPVFSWVTQKTKMTYRVCSERTYQKRSRVWCRWSSLYRCSVTGLVHGFSPEGPRYQCTHLLGQYRRHRASSGTSALRCTFLKHSMTEGGVQTWSKFLKRHIKSLCYYRRNIHNDLTCKSDSCDHITAKSCLFGSFISFTCRIFI